MFPALAGSFSPEAVYGPFVGGGGMYLLSRAGRFLVGQGANLVAQCRREGLEEEGPGIFASSYSLLGSGNGTFFPSAEDFEGSLALGSCSSSRDISLSYYLMLLPAHLMDYVILHELAHTREMNHGPEFWRLLDSLTDHRAKALRKELQTYRPVF